MTNILPSNWMDMRRDWGVFTVIDLHTTAPATVAALAALALSLGVTYWPDPAGRRRGRRQGLASG